MMPETMNGAPFLQQVLANGARAMITPATMFAATTSYPRRMRFCSASFVSRSPISTSYCAGNDAVHRGIFEGDVLRHRIDVHRDGIRRAKQNGRDGENPAAAAEIEHVVPWLDHGFQQLQAHPCGVVLSRAERHAGVELECDARVRRALLNPAGQHIQPIPDLERLIVGLPVVLPVCVVHAVDHDAERSRVVAELGFAQLCDLALDILHHGGVFRHIRDIRLHTGFVHADLVRVRIVPVDHALV